MKHLFLAFFVMTGSLVRADVTVLEQIVAKHTGQTVEKVCKDMERNYYMSAEEAKAYGVIDEVIPGAKL